MYGTLKKGPRYLEMTDGYVTGVALDEEDEIIGYKFAVSYTHLDVYKRQLFYDDPFHQPAEKRRQAE